MFAQGATASSDWSRGHAWAMYGYTAMQRHLRSASACAQQYNAAHVGVIDALLAVTVNVSQSFLQMLPTQLQVGRRLPMHVVAVIPSYGCK